MDSYQQQCSNAARASKNGGQVGAPSHVGADNNGYSRPIDQKAYAEIMGGGFGGSASQDQAYDAQNGYSQSGYGQGTPRAGQPVVGLRFASALIDTVVMIVMYLVVGTLAGVIMASGTGDVSDGKIWSAFLMMIFPGMLYGILMEASPLQGTLGKLLTGTVVTDKHGNRISFLRAVGRNLGKLFSACMPLYFPYWMLFSNKNKQSLHDMMSGTLVFKKGEGPAESIGDVFG